MTAALTTQALSATGRSAPRQLRWLLRLHRPALIACVALTVLLGAALLWLAGPVTDSAAAALKEFSACDYTPPCSYDRGAVDLHTNLYTYTTFAVLIVPFLFAAWAGGSLIGREMESGTAHFAWTQGVSPARWLVSRLAFPAALTITVTGLTGWLHRRAWAAGKHLQTSKPWDDALTFYANGTFPVALALTGLAVGVLAGLVLRRALTALATAVATIGVLWAAVHTALPSLWPSVTRVTSLEKGLEGRASGSARAS
ncbi:hypothetical protein SHKM778_91140 [Streptomyces sp. KM77-8]|uniref:ABC transporter permease n=1 Tax=Streptomyces haneummycinicus TaxID=3074435 RepID=A0AAT9HZ95_9ACTN